MSPKVPSGNLIVKQLIKTEFSDDDLFGEDVDDLCCINININGAGGEGHDLSVGQMGALWHCTTLWSIYCGVCILNFRVCTLKCVGSSMQN